jgi:type I restriction enzyme S subunit
LLQDGDIVFVRSNGNKELVGRCLLVYPRDIQTTYGGFCIRFRKKIDALDADFLLHFMKSDSSRKILNGKEGANISNLNQKILGDFEIPLPPLSEQKRIVEQLDSLSQKVRQLEEIYTKQIANCDELKQSFLKKAFEGEL